ncbi:hypothetical protein ACRCF9_11680 [Pseudomonas canadensis]|uniref:hypothetical protein n=1 Tax=Pseudomonas TaxID=286 RepID=UPI003D6A69D3
MTAIQICALIGIIISAAILYWVGYRSGLTDGKNEGYEDGHSDGLGCQTKCWDGLAHAASS